MNDSRSRLMLLLLSLVVFLTAACGAQTQSTLAKFTSRTDGSGPRGGLIADAAGNLYGTTSWGGSSQPTACQNGLFGDCGTVYELSPPPPGGGKWIETVLHVFTGIPDGNFPTGELVIDSAGNLYGTTVNGGNAQNEGLVFELSPPVVQGDPWTEAVVYRFSNSGGDGLFPNGTMAIDSAGNLYGTTLSGGACDNGTVFELSPPQVQGGSWTEQVLYSFKQLCNGHMRNDGGAPQAGLTWGPNGELFGTTVSGGANSQGTVFELKPPSGSNPNWTEHVLYGFTGGTDGAHPLGSVTVYGRKVYGTAPWAGTGVCNFDSVGCGTVFQLTPPGTPGAPWTESTIYTFTGGADGQNPYAGVTADKKGNLYGTTNGGGNQSCNDNYSVGCGVVYQLTPPVNQGDPWTETTLYQFTGGSDGRNTFAPLVIEKNALFGTTFAGGNLSCTDYGSSGCGTVFRVVP